MKLRVAASMVGMLMLVVCFGCRAKQPVSIDDPIVETIASIARPLCGEVIARSLKAKEIDRLKQSLDLVAAMVPGSGDMSELLKRVANLDPQTAPWAPAIAGVLVLVQTQVEPSENTQSYYRLASLVLEHCRVGVDYYMNPEEV